MYTGTVQYYTSLSVNKDNSENTRKNALLPHPGQRYSPRSCNTSGTSAFSFETFLAQGLSHLQHLWQNWCNILATAGAPAKFQPHCLCNISTAVVATCNISAVLVSQQHLCSVGVPATSLQCWRPCNILIAVGASATPLLQLMCGYLYIIIYTKNSYRVSI